MWHFLFGLSGRLSRASFCLFALLAFGLVLALMAALYFYDIGAGNYENGGPSPWPTSPLGIAGAGLWFFVLLFIVVSFLAVSAKRLHDREWSAWWLIVFVVFPNALSSLSQMVRMNLPESAAMLSLILDCAAIGIFSWAFIELACLRGTPGPNRFGSDPLMRAGQWPESQQANK
jgi:uncharacterized membrane protein YhaH (DUF805 family)